MENGEVYTSLKTGPNNPLKENNRLLLSRRKQSTSLAQEAAYEDGFLLGTANCGISPSRHIGKVRWRGEFEF